MLYWIPYAFVRISVSFIAGILTCIYFPNFASANAVMLAMVALIVCYCAVVWIKRRTKSRRFNPGFIGLATVFLGGYLNTDLETLSNSPLHISNHHNPISFYRAVVLGQQQEKEKTWKEVVEVTHTRSNDRWAEADGKVLLYLPRAEFERGLTYGEVLMIKGSPQAVPAPANPGEFDQRRFLSFRNITHQHFLKKSMLRAVDHDPPSTFIAMSLEAREWAEQRLEEAVKGPREAAIACALVLGITDGLDHELLGAYAATGAMHVLSVSGLHVGILYLILMLFLRPVEKLPYGKWIVAGSLLLLLWMYAYVTGLSPSVLRAVTMFSFMVIAKPLGQRTNIYNVLAASAFLILLADPFLVMSVGFQLSYIAVAGIVYLQPLMYQLYEPSSRVVDEIWKVTTVSVAAQLATFSLGLLYFHQFPNYFLLSNLYVLPLGFIVLTVGLGVLAFSVVPVIAGLLGIVLEWTIKLLNYLIFLTESLPFSVIDNIQITPWQCGLLMVVVFSGVVFLQHRRMVSLVIMIGSVTAISAVALFDIKANALPSRLVVYKVSGSSAYDLMESGQTFFFADSSLVEMESRIKFHVQPNRLMHHCNIILLGDKQRFSKGFAFGRLIAWHGKHILQLTDRDFALPHKFRIDYLIISNNSVTDLGAVLQTAEVSQIIVDSSNSFKFAEKLLRDATLNNWKLHSVWHHGAFNKTI